MSIDKSNNKDEVMADAMRNFRDARQRIEAENPGLLDRMSGLALKMQKEAEIRERTRSVVPEAINKQKNIETALKLLSLKPSGDFMHRSVRALLHKVRH